MASCLPLKLLPLLLFTMSEQALADQRPVDSAECKEITARIVRITNAQFDKFSPSGQNVFLRHPIIGDLVLFCTSHLLTGVSASWDSSGFPSNSWFAFVADAGRAVTNVQSKKLESAIRECHRTALKNETELANVEILNARVECQAFTRDGGGVAVSVWINDDDARKYMK